MLTFSSKADFPLITEKMGPHNIGQTTWNQMLQAMMQTAILRGSKVKLPPNQIIQVSQGRMIKITKIHLLLEVVVLRNYISVKSWIGMFFDLPSIKAKKDKCFGRFPELHQVLLLYLLKIISDDIFQSIFWHLELPSAVNYVVLHFSLCIDSLMLDNSDKIFTVSILMMLFSRCSFSNCACT